MAKQTGVKKGAGQAVAVSAPNFQTAAFCIVGTAPYVQNKFSAKAREQMKTKQEGGSTSQSKKKREPKDFQACYEGAIHRTSEGWIGIPATAFRNAMISACRLVGFTMTRAKLAVFVEADGFDKDDGTPLVKMMKGEPIYHEMAVRNETGVADVRARPMWLPGWQADVRVRFDRDQFTLQDVTNLLMRVGMQVGIGEGRPDSRAGYGMNWGLFSLKNGQK